MKTHGEEYEEARRKIDCTVVSKSIKEGTVLNIFRLKGYDEEIPSLIVHNESGPSGKLLLFLHGLEGRKEDALESEVFLKRSGFFHNGG